MTNFYKEGLLVALSVTAAKLSSEFGFWAKSIGELKEEDLAKDKDMGYCYPDGTLEIRLLVDGCYIDHLEVLDTLCHEMAHLKYFNHGRKFRKLYKKLLKRGLELW